MGGLGEECWREQTIISFFYDNLYALVYSHVGDARVPEEEQQLVELFDCHRCQWRPSPGRGWGLRVLETKTLENIHPQNPIATSRVRQQ